MLSRQAASCVLCAISRSRIMPPSPNRAINLTFSGAITVLMEACAIPPTARAAFDARVRHLQRLGVPTRAPAQRMSRIDYGIPEFAALATAFRLMAAFMIPALAARYVTERWGELAPFALAGARSVLPADYLSRRPIDNKTVAIIAGNALADLGQKGRHDERYVGPLGDISIVEPDTLRWSALADGAGLLLDSRTYMPAIVTHAAELAMATDADLAQELDRLRFAE